MNKYSFSVVIKGTQYDIKSDFENYEIWKGNKMLFILMPGVSNEDQPKWTVKGPAMAESGLVQKLGEEIEKNCCK